MLKSSLCDYNDAYILLKERIRITGAGADVPARLGDEKNKGVTFENCTSFTDCIREINNTQLDNAKDLDVLMSVYNLIEYSDNYSKTSESLYQYKEKSRRNDSESFKSKIKLTRNNPAAGNKKDF